MNPGDLQLLTTNGTTTSRTAMHASMKTICGINNVFPNFQPDLDKYYRNFPEYSRISLVAKASKTLHITSQSIAFSYTIGGPVPHSPTSKHPPKNVMPLTVYTVMCIAKNNRK